MNDRSNRQRAWLRWTLTLAIALVGSTTAWAQKSSNKAAERGASDISNFDAGKSGGPATTAPSGPERVAPEDLSDAITVLRDVRPEAVARIEAAIKENPAGVQKMMNERLPWINRLVRLRREDSEGYQLNVQDIKLYQKSSDLSRDLRAAKTQNKDQPTIDKISADLKQAVSDHFDVRQKIREHELKRLQDRVTQLEEQVSRVQQQLQERSDSRDKIIDENYRNLVNGQPPSSK